MSKPMPMKSTIKKEQVQMEAGRDMGGVSLWEEVVDTATVGMWVVIVVLCNTLREDIARVDLWVELVVFLCNIVRVIYLKLICYCEFVINHFIHDSFVSNLSGQIHDAFY